MSVADIETVAEVPEFLLVQGAAEFHIAVHIPVAVDVLRPGGANARHRVVGVGGGDGVVRQVRVQRDGEVLVDAVLSGGIARVEPPVGLRLQVGVSLADIQRIAGRGDVDELANAGCRNAVLGVDHERLTIFVEAGVVLPINLPVVVVAVHSGVQHVAVVTHVLATEIAVNHEVEILVTLVLLRLAITEGAADVVGVDTLTLFRRVRGVEGHGQRVGRYG